MTDLRGADQSAEILVCGVGGITADAVLGALAETGRRVRALVHRPGRRHAALAAGAVEVAVGDYDDPASLDRAMSGMVGVYFIAPVYQEREVEWTRAAVRAAEAAKVRKFVYHSVLHPYTPSMPHHARKAAGEVEVRSSSLAWTILQPAMYAQTALRMREVSMPDRVSVPFNPEAVFTTIDLRDVAACAVEVLGSERHDHAGYELAGGPALSFREMCEAMDRVAGESRSVVQVDPGDVEYADSWTAQQRAEFAAMCAEYDAHGLLGAPTAAAMLLGREPRPFGEVAARELALSDAEDR